MAPTQHTPTPWEIFRQGNRIGICSVTPDKRFGSRIAEIPAAYPGPDEEMSANARFIVTACNAHAELVEALREVERQVSLPMGDGGITLDLLERIRAALSLAAGEDRSA